ncbi:MAG TPA: nicotinate-nucleotide adenylyltransferase, partial [Candidatus Acidoferrales bacterium]|nr:nicotinate-nucleotide adenylyltransferase [Candidatus Acidoferrales bacterium]
MRIGILGGTFNPIHLAHLRSAEEVREAQGLDRVLFIPSASPPHKRQRDLASAAHRVAMVRRAIAGNSAFRVSTIELDRPGRSYSVDTLRSLLQRMPQATFTFILGIDAFREIGTWKEYRALFGLCDIVVTSRPPRLQTRLNESIPVAAQKDFCYRRRTNTLEHKTGHRIVYQEISDLEVSASYLRERLARGLSIKYLVPPSV